MFCRRFVPFVILSAAALVACDGDSVTEASFATASGLAIGGQGQCMPFSATGVTFASGPYQFSGEAQVWIDSGEPVTASVTTYLTGTIRQAPSGDGAQVVTTSHVFDFGNGDTFITEDIARLVPTRTPGVLRLLSTLRIVAGTGAFAGVPQNRNPRFVGDQDAIMNLTTQPPSATWSFSSKICGYGG